MHDACDKYRVEAIDHRSVGQVGRWRRNRHGLLGGALEHQADRNDGNDQRSNEAEHADRLQKTDDERHGPNERDYTCDLCGSPANAGIQPLPLTPCRILRRPAALVDLASDSLEPRYRAFNLVGNLGHFASMGVSVEGDAASSLAWFTPSARAI